MIKRSLIVAAIALSLIVAAKPVPTVHGVLMTEAELAALDASTTREDSQKQSKDGNAFVRALKAPFKAIGRLFGAGKKDDGKPAAAATAAAKVEIDLNGIAARLLEVPVPPGNYSDLAVSDKVVVTDPR